MFKTEQIPLTPWTLYPPLTISIGKCGTNRLSQHGVGQLLLFQTYTVQKQMQNFGMKVAKLRRRRILDKTLQSKVYIYIISTSKYKYKWAQRKLHILYTNLITIIQWYPGVLIKVIIMNHTDTMKVAKLRRRRILDKTLQSKVYIYIISTSKYKYKWAQRKLHILYTNLITIIQWYPGVLIKVIIMNHTDTIIKEHTPLP